jgi:hypothetical protein
MKSFDVEMQLGRCLKQEIEDQRSGLKIAGLRNGEAEVVKWLLRK